MEQHPVPQNVTSFQFHLVGDMTLKQFGFLAGGAIAAYVCYKLPLPVFFTIPLAVGAFLLGFGLAFVPVEERPMDVWILSFLKSVYSPTLYVWQKTKTDLSQTKAEPKKTVPLPQKPQQAPSVAIPQNTPPDSVSLGTVKSDVKPVSQQPFVPEISQPQNLPPKTGSVNLPDEKVYPAVSLPEKNGPNQEEKKAGPSQPVPEKPVTPSQTPPVEPAAPPASPAPSKNPGDQKKSWLEIFLSIFKKTKKESSPDQTDKHDTTLNMPAIPRPAKMVTEKEHLSGGSLVDTINKLVKVKEGANKDVFKDIKTPSVTGTAGNKPEQAQTDANKNQVVLREALVQNKEEVTRLTTQNTQLENKLASLEKELTTKSTSESRIVELQKQLTEVLSDKRKMEEELIELKKRQAEQKPSAPPKAPIPAGKVTDQPGRGPSVRVITPESAIKSGLPQLTTFPNVVTGIIKDYENNLLPGVLVTVRDKSGIPLRALKTNKIGQFAASTPLPNATYFIEVEDPKNQMIFDRVQITLNGNLVPAIEIVAKSQKQLNREKIAKDLFGNQGI